MELKIFQQKVIQDLIDYLEILNETKRADLAYNTYWQKRSVTVGFEGLEPYKNNIKNVPHICFKIPTGGGKTFIACNAIKPIFDSMPITKNKSVVWLVPSNAILEQTLNNLKNPYHPYRQKLNIHFNSRLEVYTKEEALNGQNFNPTVVNEQLNIFVISFDTLRSRKKEDRKMYQENANLKGFVNTYTNPETLIENIDDTALIQVINQLNPVIIVDESHNAETELSIEMLKNLNPSFILDLTATPRNNSNIISFVDSLQLKLENMVKLPVVVYNHHNKEDVISDAIELRRNLEEKALLEERLTGNHLRPIVLFQAQPKSKEENDTFEKLKEKLIESGIPKEHIAIKTSNINELKNIDLNSKDCPIRFIITVNALKEGWDCPFAYILATLANRNSKIDVEQILGRILRLPYVTKHNEYLLNLSYVFTCSENFWNTLDNVVKGLNRAGYSKRDFRIAEELTPPEETNLANKYSYTQEDLNTPEASTLISDKIGNEEFLEFKTEDIKTNIKKTQEISEIMINTAKNVEDTFNEKLQSINNENPFETTSEELKDMMNVFKIKEVYKNEIKNLKIPQFFLKIPQNLLYENLIKLSKENLLDDFTLQDKDTIISFETANADIYKIDLEQQSENEFVPKYLKMNKAEINYINEYMSKLSEEEKINTFKEIVFKQIGKINSIGESDAKSYIEKILRNLTKDQLYELESSPFKYAIAIKKKILNLQEIFMEKEFYSLIDKNKIVCKESFTFKDEITPLKTTSSIAKSLYEAEESMNDFEYKVITEIASFENVKFWHRNINRKEFCINGYTNHYPDFIVKTMSNKIIIIETKGDHLTNEENIEKLKLGRKWQELSGEPFKYFMVFQDKKINKDGAYNLEEFIQILKEL